MLHLSVPPFPPCNSWSFYWLYRFSSSNMRLRFFHVFSWLYSLFLLALNDIPLFRCTTVYLSFHLLKDTLFASKFSQLWIKLLQISMYRFFKYSNHLGKYQGACLPRYYSKSKFSFIKNCSTVFHSGCTILHFLMPHILISIWCCQYFGFWLF